MSGEKPVILVGRKPTMNYVTAALLALKDGRGLILKARGRAISRAVDVSQILVNRFAKDHEVKEVEIGTDEVKREDGSMRPTGPPVMEPPWVKTTLRISPRPRVPRAK